MHLANYEHQLHLDLNYEDHRTASRNEFSGDGYRVLNFVVDIPIRLDAYLPPPEQDLRERKSRIGFMLVEFQIMDQLAALQNESGENSHQR